MSIRSVYGLSGLLTYLKQSVHSYTHAYFCLCTLQQHHHKNSHRNHQKRNNYFPGSRFTGINELLVLLVFLDRERGYFSCFWLETWLSSPLGDECEKIENNSHDAGHASEGERRWFWRLHMGVGGGVRESLMWLLGGWRPAQEDRKSSGYHGFIRVFPFKVNGNCLLLWGLSSSPIQIPTHFRFTKYSENWVDHWVLVRICHDTTIH